MEYLGKYLETITIVLMEEFNFTERDIINLSEEVKKRMKKIRHI